MTDEELKNIEAPKKTGEKKPLTEREKKRNTVFLQLGGSLLLALFAAVFAPVGIIGAKYYFIVKMGRDENSLTTILSVILFIAIVLAWWLSRLVCKVIVHKYLKDKITADAVEIYK